MAGSNLMKFRRPEVLRELAFDNLIALLRQFKGYFDRVNFSIEGKTEKDFDFERLAQILTDQLFPGDYSELFNAFGLIGAMSTENRADTLREFIDAQPYVKEATEKMTAADLAMLVYLHDPQALNDIDVQWNATKKRSFAMRAASRDISTIVVTNAMIAEFQRLMNTAFSAHHRGNTARIYPPTAEGDELWIIIRHGDSFKRQGAVDDGPKSKTLAFQPESFDLLVLNKKTGELRICVPSDPQWLEDSYAGNFSKALFGNYDSFSIKRNNDLERIKELKRNVTIYRGDAPVKRLDLLSLKLYYSPTSKMLDQLTASSGNLFNDLEENRRDLSEAGLILEAQFAVKIGRKEKIITLKNNNRSGYDYDEFGQIIDEWLRQVGIIHSSKTSQEARHVEGTDAVGPLALAV
jgi:hypothetical protein